MRQYPIIFMKKSLIGMKTLFPVFFIIAMLSAGCSATATKRSFGQVVDDSVIHVKLKTKFAKDKLVKARDINIDVYKGVVTLQGIVETQAQINRAIEIAEQQAGVREVKAYLVLKSVAGQTRKKRSGVVVEDISVDKTLTDEDQIGQKNVKEGKSTSEKESTYQDVEF